MLRKITAAIASVTLDKSVPNSSMRDSVIRDSPIPDDTSNKSLAQAYREFGGDAAAEIPWIVWLLENPDSPLALGGSISLRNHDYLHILLGRGFSLEDEAFVIGVTMGNDNSTGWLDYAIFKIAACFLYPWTYRLSGEHLRVFERGVALGRSLPFKNLNRFDFRRLDALSVRSLRQIVGLDEAP